jgi:hypothetical protein
MLKIRTQDQGILERDLCSGVDIQHRLREEPAPYSPTAKMEAEGISKMFLAV